MKFAVWGVGKLGKILLQYLHKDKVAVYIESDVNLQGIEYQGIPVVDFERYMSEYYQYPIIVSPLQAETEIIGFLKKKGIDWCFPLSEYKVSIAGFCLQAPIEALSENYDKGKKIYIYGFNPLSIIMYTYFTQKGYRCKIILQADTGEHIRAFVQNEMLMEIATIASVEEKSPILLSEKLTGQDEMRLKKNAYVENYYDIGIRRNLYSNPQIAKFKNMHKGQRCFIVATGPSVTVKDLNVLQKNSEICISMNGIFKIFDGTEWRPDYYIISDVTGMRLWKESILQMDVKEKFISDIAWQFEEDDIPKNMHRWHLQDEWRDGKEPEFSDDFSKRGFLGYTVTYDGALQLAAYMGFGEIYLLGVDCKQYDTQNKQHFVKDYSSEKSELKIDKILLSYQAAKKYADAHGIKIYNATRGGELEVFERVDFDSLFEEKEVNADEH